MKKFLLLFFVGLISSNLLAQNNIPEHWFDANENAILIPPNQERITIPIKYRTLALDMEALKTTLSNAPMEFTSQAESNPKIITLPMPDGTDELFKVVESPVMASGLAAKYPEIKSFSAIGLNNPLLRARFDYGVSGFRAMIGSPDGVVFIDPYVPTNNVNYISYFKKDRPNTAYEQSLGHGTHDHHLAPDDIEFMKPIKGGPNSPFKNSSDNDDAPENTTAGDPVELKIYRAAFAATGEFTISQGGTVSAALSEIVFAASRLNFVFEKETAVRFELVDNNDLIIYTDPSSDPYQGPNVQSYFIQNTDNINTTIGENNYDVGHLFAPAGCQSFGNNVAGTSGGVGIICSSSKANGVSCSNNPGNNFYLDVLAHEVGHQLGGEHTWNNCTPFLNGTDPNNPNPNPQISLGSAYEPGSGSTIMSYGGLCGVQNVQFGADPYLHVVSIEEIKNFTVGNGSCATVMTTNNNEPDVSIPFGDGVFIPISTPFELTAEASDPNTNDTLTYCWEQFDLGPISPIGSPIGNAPAFRTFPPTENPTRIFPRINTIIANSSAPTEVLPTYSRDLTFRCTVRDSKWGGGGTVWEQIAFEATDAAGPFLVMHPNTTTDMKVGEYVEVTWDVANTDIAPVNCNYVNILLSTDAGFNYPLTLASNVPNTGSYTVLIPDAITNAARVKIKAADNIFFDISNMNSKIEPADTPGFAFAANPYFQKVCLPELPTYEINTLSLLNYDSLVQFEVLGLPAGATAEFSANPVMASQGTTLTINTANTPDADGNFQFQVMAFVAGQDTIYQDLAYETRATDFSDFSMAEPSNGMTAISEVPAYSWIEANAADQYEIEIASDPSFSAASIVETAVVTGASYQGGVQLDLGGIYFWRVRPMNECSQGDWSTANAFAIKSLSCSSTTSTDGSITIPSSGTPTVESKINIASSGNISDLNITNITGNHQAFKDIAMHLVGPDGTSITLFTNIFCLASQMDFGMDDEAADPIGFVCPVNTGVSFIPQNDLSAFDNKDAQGEWTLQVEVTDDAGSGGKLDEWTLEICSEANLSPPDLIVNETMPLPPTQPRDITEEFLHTEDPNNTDDELLYTIVTLPAKGNLFLNGTQLTVGDKFSQQSSSAGNVSYEYTGGAMNDTDSFTFTVEDGEGGLIATPQFNIEIDPTIIISTEDLLNQNDISIFPNPANDLINIGFTKSINEPIAVQIFNVQGQLLAEKFVENSDNIIQMNTNRFANGIYLVQVRTESQSLTKRVTIQR